ncbi:MAG TPA: hypothetical protein VM871_00145 [Flavisolibacter sp.]|nr:hypothetical protein [Flavisolibacter sp.]
MKRIFLLSAVFSIAFFSCRKIEVDGETTVVTNPTNPTTGGQTITLKGRIDSNMTLTPANNYIIDGFVYVMPNRTLTIQPGVTIKANYTGSNVGALIITRGAKINADGSATSPIVFTSGNPSPRSGDWGGIVILGKAPVNATSTAGAGTFVVEGGVNTSDNLGVAGGTDTADNSGTLRYVRIEYAGYAQQPDQEINSLTMAAVGNRTVIEYVQVLYAKDDAYEWFGGTVNCRYLVAYKTQDDDFDSDNGFSGSVQFGLIFRDSAIADISRSEAFESDNDANGTANMPKTLAVFSNVTAIGPRASATNLGNSLYLAGAHIRRNSGISIYNSVFLGWPQGVVFDDSRGLVSDDIFDSTVRFAGNLIAGTPTPFAYVTGSGSATNATAIDAHFRNSFYKNTVLTNNEQVGYTRAFDYTNPDFAPFASANVNVPGFPAGPNPIVNLGTVINTVFTDARISTRTYITTVGFRGAIGPSGEGANWYKGWTRFN